MKYLDLLNVQCKGNTSPMAVYLYNYLCKKGNVTFDETGNLWFNRGVSVYYPLIVAHMDTVQDVDFKKVFYEENGNIRGRLHNKPCGIGADDKNGIYVALRLIEKTDIPLKCLFTHGEETGADGSYETSKNDFTDVAYMLQFDRKGNTDVIQYGSDEFYADVLKIGEKFGYRKSDGIFTDVTVLSQKHGISAVNLSCGYYFMHLDGEYTNIAELENAVNLGLALIAGLTKPYPFEYREKYRSSVYNGKAWKDLEFDDTYTGICDCCGTTGKLRWNENYLDYICSDCAGEIDGILQDDKWFDKLKIEDLQ